MQAAATIPLTQSEAPPIVWPLIEAMHYGGDLREAFREQVNALGFEWFALLLANHSPTGLGGGPSILTDAPEGYPEFYRERNFQRVDPRHRAAARSGLPQVWDQSTYADDPATHELFETTAWFGIGHGIHIALHHPDAPFVSFFTLGSPEMHLSSTRKQAISQVLPSLWCLGAYGRKLLHRRTRASRGARQLLSPRELECLKHVARGLTSREIGTALDISERTVNAHIDRGIRKCGARNRQEAVAHAITAGLLPA